MHLRCINFNRFCGVCAALVRKRLQYISRLYFIIKYIKLRILGFFLIQWISMEFCPQKFKNRQTFLTFFITYKIKNK